MPNVLQWCYISRKNKNTFTVKMNTKLRINRKKDLKRPADGEIVSECQTRFIGDKFCEYNKINRSGHA